MKSSVIEPGTIAPPAEHFELGQRITYHHRACVARLPKRSEPMGKGIFAEPVRERKWEVIHVEGGGPDPINLDDWTDGTFVGRMRTQGVKINKTIVVWPQLGEGMVVGMIRRGIGLSVSGYTSGYETPEYEPGYFEVHEWHWLYQVKRYLQQKELWYVPLWAARRA